MCRTLMEHKAPPIEVVHLDFERYKNAVQKKKGFGKWIVPTKSLDIVQNVGFLFEYILSLNT